MVGLGCRQRYGVGTKRVGRLSEIWCGSAAIGREQGANKNENLLPILYFLNAQTRPILSFLAPLWLRSHGVPQLRWFPIWRTFDLGCAAGFRPENYRAAKTELNIWEKLHRGEIKNGR